MPALRRSRPPRASSAPIAISLRKYRSAEPSETRAAAASAAGSIHLPAAATRRQSCWDRSGGTAQARRLSKRAGARAARSGTPHGPRNCSTATTPERAPGRVAATSRRTADKAASARGSNCGDKTGRWDETSRTAPEPAMVKSVPPAPDSASVTAARTGRSTKTVPLAVTTITISTGTDNRVEWPALGPTHNLGKPSDAMTYRSTAPRSSSPALPLVARRRRVRPTSASTSDCEAHISLTSATRLDVRRGRIVVPSRSTCRSHRGTVALRDTG